MMELPAVAELFPRSTRSSIARFWLIYWFWFFALLPWMLLRQAGLILQQLIGALWTWNRDVALLGGSLRLRFMNNLRALAVTSIFGERFTAIQYEDVLIDPGPVFAQANLPERLAGADISAIVATHAHEEHTGNATIAAEVTGAPVWGSEITLAAVREPEILSGPRRFFIGQPRPTEPGATRRLGATLATPRVTLQVIESPGHCAGHSSLFDESTGILFAGDSFLHTIFTAPNREVRSDEWMATLQDYLQRPIRTMVGTHGYIFTTDPRLPPRGFVIKHRDPLEMIRDKLTFLTWARAVVREGERRQLPYSVIEACLFPWKRRWAWENWFADEGGRLFSGGEFSRTYFIRSLSDTPERVPPRFPPFARMVQRLGGPSSG